MHRLCHAASAVSVVACTFAGHLLLAGAGAPPEDCTDVDGLCQQQTDVLGDADGHLSLLQTRGRAVNTTVVYEGDGGKFANLFASGATTSDSAVDSRRRRRRRRRSASTTTRRRRPSSKGCGGKCRGGVCFGTWNIQNLGPSKGRRPAVMKAIREVLARYDVVAIQELSQKPRAPYECGPYTESVICAARPDHKKYSIAASPRIGDEQYVVMTRDAAAEVSGQGEEYPDPRHKHSRPPYAVNVIVKRPSRRKWKLAIATTHTSPRQATREITNFPEVLRWMNTTFGRSGAKHYLIAGDYNADGSYFKDDHAWKHSRLDDHAWKGYTLLTDNHMDSTVATSSNAYDRIIVDDGLAAKAGSAQVFRLEELDLTDVHAEGCKMGYVPSKLCQNSLAGLSWSKVPDSVKTQLAKELSDHHPVEVCLRG